jgi:hypothetical protein
LGVAFALAAVDVAPPEKALRPTQQAPHQRPPPERLDAAPDAAVAAAAEDAAEDAELRAAIDRALLGCLQVGPRARGRLQLSTPRRAAV